MGRLSEASSRSFYVLRGYLQPEVLERFDGEEGRVGIGLLVTKSDL